MSGPANPAAAAGDPDATGVVFDIGYQRYAGPREGRNRARRAVYRDGIRKALGLGRGARTKLLPWGFISLLVVIGVVMAVMAGAGQRALGDAGANLLVNASHRFYYAFTITILFVFAALVAPRLLCPDRRNGTLHLYLVRPLTSTDYLAARWAAFLTVMVVVSWLPQFVLLTGRVLGHPEPVSYLADTWNDIPRFLLSGLATGALVTTVAMLASGLATRRGYASVVLIALYLIPATIARPISLIPEFQWVAIFDLGQVLGEMNTLIFDGSNPEAIQSLLSQLAEQGPADFEAAGTRFTPTFLLTAYLVWLVAPGVLVWRYYRRLTR